MPQINLDVTSIKPNDSMAEVMTEKEFRMYIIKMILEANDEIREQIHSMNDCTNKPLKEQMQEAKDLFNK